MFATIYKGMQRLGLPQLQRPPTGSKLSKVGQDWTQPRRAEFSRAHRTNLLQSSGYANVPTSKQKTRPSSSISTTLPFSLPCTCTPASSTIGSASSNSSSTSSNEAGATARTGMAILIGARVAGACVVDLRMDKRRGAVCSDPSSS